MGPQKHCMYAFLRVKCGASTVDGEWPNSNFHPTNEYVMGLTTKICFQIPSSRDSGGLNEIIGIDL